MAVFGGMTLTNKGLVLQGKAQAGLQLKYTRIAIGDGSLNGQSIPALNALISQKMNLPITRTQLQPPNKAVIGTVLNNGTVTSGFFFREVGVFAQDPDLGEILYAYANAGVTADYIPAGGGSDIVEKVFDCRVVVGTASNITAEINESLVFALKSQVDAEFDAASGHKHTGAAGDGPKLTADSLAAGAATDIVIGNRTIIDTEVPADDTGAPNKLWGWLAYMIKAITGKSSWRTAPATTLEAAKTHADDTTRHITAAERTDWNGKLPASSYTANDVLDKLKTVDGTGSGIDSDTTDGFHLDQDVRTTASPTFYSGKISNAADAILYMEHTAGIADAKKGYIAHQNGLLKLGTVTDAGLGTNQLTVNNTGVVQAKTLELNKGTTNTYALKLTSSSAGWGSGMYFENTTPSTGKTYGIYSGSEGNLHIGPLSGDAIIIGPDKVASFVESVLFSKGFASVGGLAQLASGGETLKLIAGQGTDHTYLSFFARSAAPTIRSAYVGFGGAGSQNLDISNEIPGGNMQLLTSNGKVTVEGILDLRKPHSRDFGILTKQYSNVGATYTDGTGTLKITLPRSWSNTMYHIKLMGYEFSGSGAWELSLGGYAYAGASTWLNTNAYSGGAIPETTVRFGHDGTNCCILIGTTSSTWAVMGIVIKEVLATYSSVTGLESGWSMGIITSEAGITVSSTPVLDANTNAYLLRGMWPDAWSNANTIAHRDSSGNLTANRFVSTVAQGTAPLVVTSTTMVSNLNSEMLYGMKHTQFQVWRDLPSANLNDATTPGMYLLGASSSYTNGPGLDWCNMTVSSNSAGYVEQEVVGVGTWGKRFRIRTETGSWGLWTEVVLKDGTGKIPGVSANRMVVRDSQLTTTASTTVASFTVPNTAIYTVKIVLRVTGTRNVAINVNYAGPSGSKSRVVLPATDMAPDDYDFIPATIYCNAGSNINVVAQTTLANSAYVGVVITEEG